MTPRTAETFAARPRPVLSWVQSFGNRPRVARTDGCVTPGPGPRTVGPEAPSPAKPTHRPDKPAWEPLFLPKSGLQPPQHDLPRSSDRTKHAPRVRRQTGSPAARCSATPGATVKAPPRHV